MHVIKLRPSKNSSVFSREAQILVVTLLKHSENVQFHFLRNFRKGLELRRNHK